MRLTMDVVIIRVVPEEMLKRIQRESKSTMIVNSLRGRNSEEENPLTRRHQCAGVGDSRSKSIEDESFDRVVVKRSEGVGNVESVMPRVDMAVEELVGVEVAVEEVLPCIQYESASHDQFLDSNSILSDTHEAKKNWNIGTAHQYVKLAISSPYRCTALLPSLLPNTDMTIESITLE